MTSKMDKIRKAMEELNIKDNLVRISKDRFITVNTVDGEQTEILKELKEIDGVGKTVEQLVRDIKDTADRIRTLKRDYGRKIWRKNQ